MNARQLPVSALVLTVALLLAAGEAQARMYQWVQPGTGVTQLSGEPPPWYRAGRDAPRVVVFENGNLIDDTAIEVTLEQEQLLRNEAFQMADELQRAEAVRMLERTARSAAARRAREAPAPVAAAAPVEPEPPSVLPGEEVEPPEQFDSTLVQTLKAIVEAYDRQAVPAQ